MHSDILGGNSFFFFPVAILIFRIIHSILVTPDLPPPWASHVPCSRVVSGLCRRFSAVHLCAGLSECIGCTGVCAFLPPTTLHCAHLRVGTAGVGSPVNTFFSHKSRFWSVPSQYLLPWPPAVSQTCTSCHPWWVSTAHGDTDVLDTLASPACCPSQNKAPGESPRSSLLVDRPHIWESSKILYSLSGIELGHIRQAFYHWAIALELCQVLYVQVTKTRYSAQFSPQS